MYYGESIFDNDHIKFAMSQSSRKAAEGWRFRHLKGVVDRILNVAWTGAKGFVAKALHVGEPGGESMVPKFGRLTHV